MEAQKTKRRGEPKPLGEPPHPGWSLRRELAGPPVALTSFEEDMVADIKERLEVLACHIEAGQGGEMDRRRTNLALMAHALHTALQARGVEPRHTAAMRELRASSTAPSPSGTDDWVAAGTVGSYAFYWNASTIWALLAFVHGQNTNDV